MSDALERVREALDVLGEAVDDLCPTRQPCPCSVPCERSQALATLSDHLTQAEQVRRERDWLAWNAERVEFQYSGPLDGYFAARAEARLAAAALSMGDAENTLSLAARVVPRALPAEVERLREQVERAVSFIRLNYCKHHCHELDCRMCGNGAWVVEDADPCDDCREAPVDCRGEECAALSPHAQETGGEES